MPEYAFDIQHDTTATRDIAVRTVCTANVYQDWTVTVPAHLSGDELTHHVQRHMEAAAYCEDWTLNAQQTGDLFDSDRDLREIDGRAIEADDEAALTAENPRHTDTETEH